MFIHYLKSWFKPKEIPRQDDVSPSGDELRSIFNISECNVDISKWELTPDELKQLEYRRRRN